MLGHKTAECPSSARPPTRPPSTPSARQEILKTLEATAFLRHTAGTSAQKFSHHLTGRNPRGGGDALRGPAARKAAPGLRRGGGRLLGAGGAEERHRQQWQRPRPATSDRPITGITGETHRRSEQLRQSLGSPRKKSESPASVFASSKAPATSRRRPSSMEISTRSISSPKSVSCSPGVSPSAWKRWITSSQKPGALRTTRAGAGFPRCSPFLLREARGGPYLPGLPPVRAFRRGSQGGTCRWHTGIAGP